MQSVRQRWASGGTTAVGGTGAIFFDWANPNWRYGAGENQKILAHELFHVFQYQLDKLVNNGSTPASQVRPSSQGWLDCRGHRRWSATASRPTADSSRATRAF